MNIGELYSEYEQTLRRYAIRLTSDAQWADDLVQDTFVKSMSHINLLSILPRSQCRAWLYKTLKNLFIDEIRTDKRHDALLDTLSEPQRFGEDRALEHAAQPDLIELAPEQYQELVYMRYVLDMNSTEIGAELGVPAATIRSRLHLAIQHMRRNKHRLE